MGERAGEWMQVVSGRQFWPADPRPDDIDVRDIAHALSRQCRFGGHILAEHYSVAEHSVRVSYAVQPPTASIAAWRLAALLHDATEAYLIDVPRPVKCMLGGYKELESRLAEVIGLHFGIPHWMFEDTCVKAADEQLLMTEKRDLLRPAPADWTLAQGVACEPLAARIEPWTQAEAERRFLARFEELEAQR